MGKIREKTIDFVVKNILYGAAAVTVTLSAATGLTLAGVYMYDGARSRIDNNIEINDAITQQVTQDFTDETEFEYRRIRRDLCLQPEEEESCKWQQYKVIFNKDQSINYCLKLCIEPDQPGYFKEAHFRREVTEIIQIE